MAQACNGDTVRVHYTGRLDDGSIFDSSEGSAEGCGDHGHSCGCGSNESEPMEFVLGEGKLLPKFEAAVLGLEPGQSVTVKIVADEAYGQRMEEMVAVVPRSEIPAEMKPQVGDSLEVILQDGSPMPVMVTEAGEESITLDANHPLAGMDLTFDIRLVQIV